MLLFTYFFEELGHIQKGKQNDEASKVFNLKALGNLKSFKTANAELVFSNGQFETVNPRYLADKVKIDSLFGILGQIKISRFLTSLEIQKLDESLFFPDKNLWFKFFLENGQLEVHLGKKIEFNNTFYLKMKRSDQKDFVWGIAYDDSPVDGVYSQEEDRTHLAKYERMATLLLLKTDFFWDDHLLKNEIDVSKINLTNTRNRPFEVDLINQRTSPQILNGLNFSKDAADQFVKELFKLRAKKIFHDAKKENLKELLGKMNIITKKGSVVTLELYKSFNKRGGYFVRSNLEPTLYEIGQETARFFYLNVQDFWHKTLLEFSTSTFILSNGEKQFSLKRTNDGRFFSTQEMKINESQFDKLFQILARPADRVDELEKNELIPSSSLVLQFEKYRLYFYRLDQELIVYNEQLKIKFHYFVGEMPISFKLMDYFK